MNIAKKFFRRICRSIAKLAFPNNFRVSLFRMVGIKIGEKVVVSEGFTLACEVGYEENLLIDDRVAIGPDTIVILTSDPNFSKLRKLKETHPSVEVRGSVHVKHDAWIGAGCIILPNITIGEFSIIGAGSVVTNDVPPFTIVAGVPAKIVKRIDKKARESLLCGC